MLGGSQNVSFVVWVVHTWTRAPLLGTPLQPTERWTESQLTVFILQTGKDSCKPGVVFPVCVSLIMEVNVLTGELKFFSFDQETIKTMAMRKFLVVKMFTTVAGLKLV